MKKITTFLDSKLKLTLPKIAFFALVWGVLMVAQIAFLWVEKNPDSILIKSIQYIFSVIPSVQFKLLNFDDSILVNQSIGNNFFNFFSISTVVYIVLLFVSLLLFYFTKFRESRLLRFLFALVIVNILVSFIYTFIFLLKKHDNVEFINYVLIFVYILVRLFWLFIFITIFQKINTQKEVATVSLNDDYVDYVYPSKWQRVFHLFVDTILSLFIVSSLFIAIDFQFFEKFSSIVGDRNSLLVTLLFCRIIYYIITESLLSTSLAKILTETRIVDRDGNAISFSKAVTRTFSRFVPFESVSFLGEGTGWHDKWSNTLVVKEVRNGWSSTAYFLTIPIIIILFFASIWGSDKYREYKYEKAQNEKHEFNYNTLKGSVEHLSVNDIVVIRNVNGNEPNLVHIKVINIVNDNLTVQVIENMPYDASLLDKTAKFTQFGNYLLTFDVKKSDLLNSIHKNYFKDAQPSKGFSFEKYGNYEVESIFNLNKPLISTESYVDLGKSTYFNLNFKNSGLEFEIISIKKIKGNLDIVSPTPFIAEGINETNSYEKSFSVSITNYELDTNYEIELVTKTKDSKIHKFIITGENNNYNIRPVYK